jgi:hypothetical protein
MTNHTEPPVLISEEEIAPVSTSAQPSEDLESPGAHFTKSEMDKELAEPEPEDEIPLSFSETKNDASRIKPRSSGDK